MPQASAWLPWLQPWQSKWKENQVWGQANMVVRPTSRAGSRAHHGQSPHSTQTGPSDLLSTHIPNPIFYKVAREIFLKHIPDNFTPSIKLLRVPQGPQPVIQGISLSSKAFMTCCSTMRNIVCLYPGFLAQSKWKPHNFLNVKDDMSIFCYNTWFLYRTPKTWNFLSDRSVFY